jgi:hypothetical protein
MTIPDLEALLQQMRQLFADEYARGEKAAIDRIVHAAQNEPQQSGHDSRESRPRRGLKKRAPSGAAPAFVNRMLSESGSKGATALEIHNAAKTPIEKMVSYSGVRFALTQGREKGRYRNKNGKWFLRENKSAENAA